MPEGVGYSGSNIVAGAGKTLNHVGNYVWAFSGILSGNPVDVLDFRTGKEITEIQYQLPCDWDGLGSDQLFIKLYINEEQVSNERANVNSGEGPPLNIPYHILLPPLTRFRLSIGCDSGSFACFLKGKVIK